jgi:hypothetical protein
MIEGLQGRADVGGHCRSLTSDRRDSFHHDADFKLK